MEETLRTFVAGPRPLLLREAADEGGEVEPASTPREPREKLRAELIATIDADREAVELLQPAPPRLAAYLARLYAIPAIRNECRPTVCYAVFYFLISRWRGRCFGARGG